MSCVDGGRSLKEIQKEINDWGNATFRGGDDSIDHVAAHKAAKHLNKESYELLNETILGELADPKHLGDEIADVLFLAMQVAGESRAGLRDADRQEDAGEPGAGVAVRPGSGVLRPQVEGGTGWMKP